VVGIKFSMFLLVMLACAVESVGAFEVGPKVTFSFDDGSKRIFENAAPVLAEYGFPGVLYGESGPLNSGEDWVMSWDEVRSLRDGNGWEIGSHTISHPYLTGLSDVELERELLGSRDDFAAEGIDVKSFASPYGDYDARVLTAIARYYESHREAWGGANGWSESYNDYRLVSREIKHTTSVEEVKGWVDEAIAGDQWLIFLLHDIVEGVAEEYEYNVDDFAEVVEYVAGRVEVVTMSEGLEYSGEVNLVEDFSFSDLDGAGWTRGWSRDGDVKVDRNDHGDVFGSRNSVKIVGGSDVNMLISGEIGVVPGMDYVLKMFQNVQGLGRGGWAVWVDEFDKSGAYSGGQWLGGNYADFVGSRYYEYSPSSSDVTSLNLIIYSEAGSDFVLYLDSVFFSALGPVSDPDPDPDDDPPVISLNGEGVVNLNVGEEYVEEGAVAIDDVDGDLSGLIVIEGDVDVSVAGEYIVVYSVSDSAGNLVEVERVVNVLREMGESLVPNYDFE